MTGKLEIAALRRLGAASSPAPAPIIDISGTLETRVHQPFVPFSAAESPPQALFRQTLAPMAGTFAVAPASMPDIEIPATLDVASVALPQVVSWRNSALYRPSTGSAHSPSPALHIPRAPRDQESS